MSRIEASSGVLPDGASASEDIAHFVVEAAVNTPSVHNTQPWWFHGADHEIGVHADDERRLPVADPDGRELMNSCGAALFTARVALRYLGIVPEVQLFPEPGLAKMVAKISWTETAQPAGYERELFAEIRRRRTHRGGFDAEPLPEGILAALTDEASKAVRQHIRPCGPPNPTWILLWPPLRTRAIFRKNCLSQPGCRAKR